MLVIKRFPVTIQAHSLVFDRETLYYRNDGRAPSRRRGAGVKQRGDCARLFFINKMAMARVAVIKHLS
jgi:hypothetical protein